MEPTQMHCQIDGSQSFNLYIQMVKSKTILIFLLYILTFYANCQNIENKTYISLNQSLELHLEEKAIQQYFIIAPQKSKYASQLFIKVQPKYADPLEVPYITISSDNNYSKLCFNAAIQFAGICNIKEEELTSKREFKLELKCATTCDLIVETYLSPYAILAVGSNVQLSAHKEVGLTEIIEIPVREMLNYTGLTVMAMILNLEQNIEVGDEGVQLLINYGNGSIQEPSESSYQERGVSLNGVGKGIIISSDKIHSLSTIKCYISLKKGLSVRLSVISMNDNQLNIDFGKAYFDYAGKQTPKLYLLNMQAYNLTQSNKTLQIVFDIYSGSPDFFIAFDRNFSNPIEFNRKLSAVSILLSPELRKKYNSTDIIYIKVQSQDPTEYYFYTLFIRDDVTFIEPYFAYLDEVSNGKLENYMMSETYKYLEGSNETFKNYSFKVDIVEGRGSFYFKRCKTYEVKSSDVPTFRGCLVNDPEYLKNSSFYAEEIQNKHILTGSLLTITMLYDISQCTQIGKSEGNIFVKCAFVIIAASDSSQIFEYSLLPERKFFTNYLRENKVIKDYIPKGNYAYYVFSLPQIQGINEINIFVTTFSGDTALLVSSTDRLPTLDSPALDLLTQSGAKNNIVLKESQLAPELYISVFAYQFTEINIGVIVNRNSSNSSVHEIPLSVDNVQTYTLNKTQDTAYFKFNSKNAAEITIFLNQLSGRIKMQVFDQKNKATQCQNHTQNPFICRFFPQNNSNYRVKVTGDKNHQNKFTITYKTEKHQCFTGKLNQPTFVNLRAKSIQCFTFNINREISIAFASAFTHIQLFQGQITTRLLINQQFIQTINKTHRIITLEDMNTICPLGLSLSGFPEPCRLTLSFENSIASVISFSFIMQEEDVEIALFDGIVEKVKQESFLSGSGKSFYYPVSNHKLIQLFFTTHSSRSSYFLAAHFVPKVTFLNRNNPGIDIYLPYVIDSERSPEKDMRKNYYSTVLGRVSLERIAIDQPAIKGYCPSLDCYLVISIYPQAKDRVEGEENEYEYEIEVSQEETYLALGESKIGMLNKNEYFTYLIDPEDGIIEFRTLNDEGKSSVCLSASAALSNGTIVKGNQFRSDLQVAKAQNIELIFVKGEKERCSYEIKYISNKQPFQSVHLSHPYEIQVKGGEVERFIYYHQNPRTFRIVQMMSAGNAEIYVMPIRQRNFTLSLLPNLKLSDFPTFTSKDGEYIVESSNANFCSNCYYYIVITAQTKFVGLVLFLRIIDPIPLVTSHILTEWLKPESEFENEDYIFYSLTTFDITFNVLSGKVAVQITDPEEKIVVLQSITQKTTFNIKSLEYKEQERIEQYSERTKYKIRVSAVTETEFYVQISRKHLTQRLFEGFPTVVFIDAVMSQTIEFINSEDLQKPIHLMANIDQQNETLLTFTVTAQKPNGALISNDQIVRNITRSENTYTLSLNNFQARYYLAITSKFDVTVTLLLVRSALTYISPTHNYLFNEEGEYQIYSDYRNVLMEVFSCQGDVALAGQARERDTNAKSAIEVKRPNYGGHIVCGIETNYSTYYIHITNKDKNVDIEYMMNYYYYEEVNPYDVIDVWNYEISFNISKEGISLKVNQPKLTVLKNNSTTYTDIKIVSIDYFGYVSDSKHDLNRYSRCSINGNAVKKIASSPSFLMENSLFQNIINNSTQKLYISVQASIKIQLTTNNQSIARKYPQVLTIFYNNIEIPFRNQKQQVQYVKEQMKYLITNSVTSLIGWLIFMVCFTFVLPYFIVKWCIRKYKMGQKNMVEQVEVMPSSQTAPSSQHMAKSGTLPHTGIQLFKENI